jgi:CRISPR/Cas system-associated endonuclease Cas1
MEYGRVSLACDMVEPFRSIFCDRFTLSLFNLKILSSQDFEAQDDGIFFTQEAKKKFFTYYAEELLKTKSYSLIQGNFQALLNIIIIWMKNCISEGKVIPIEVPK